MNKVVSMNLNGNAYQLDEPGFAALSAYLVEARGALAGNPDQEEIMADIEQAIADKLRRFLSAHKSVVTEDEARTVIAEMGPVGGEEQKDSASSQKPSGPKRLYRIPEGEYLGGVATGLAAYLDIDVHLIRITMIVLLLITSGGFIFGYILAWIFIPVARTPEQLAKAEGAPFNAEEIIARTKAAVERGRTEGAQHWKEWKHSYKADRKAYKYTYKYPIDYTHHPRSTVGQLVTLLVIAFFAWLGYHHIPVLHEFFDSIWALVHSFGDWVAQNIVSR